MLISAQQRNLEEFGELISTHQLGSVVLKLDNTCWYMYIMMQSNLVLQRYESCEKYTHDRMNAAFIFVKQEVTSTT